MFSEAFAVSVAHCAGVSIMLDSGGFRFSRGGSPPRGVCNGGPFVNALFLKGSTVGQGSESRVFLSIPPLFLFQKRLSEIAFYSPGNDIEIVYPVQ
jgi:hypothetical protein